MLSPPTRQGLEHQFHDGKFELEDDELDEEGDEIDASPNGVASQMLIDAHGVSARLDVLAAGLALKSINTIRNDFGSRRQSRNPQ
jgi:hypothetical protein